MKTIVVVGAAIIKEDQVMLARRGPGMSNPGFWEFPGGKVESGETHDEALVRELFEELGVRVRVDNKAGDADAIYGNLRVELHVYRCGILDGRLQLREHDEMMWVALNEMPDLHLGAADRAIFQRMVRASLS